MASRIFARSLFSRSFATASLIPRCSPSASPSPSPSSLSIFSLLRLRPLTSAAAHFSSIAPSTGLRCFSTRRTTSSLNDSSPNWSNRPPKETILLDGCDFEHWLVVMEKPEGEPTRDEIIDSYIKTLATVVGSEEEARMKIYSVSTRCYWAFGALVSEELSYKLKELPKVRWVLPDSYLDVKNKDYGGEPFINGQAVPYDPKYHEEWIRNNNRAMERNRRNDRPRNYDRSRNFDRRRQMQNAPSSNMGPPLQNNMPPPPQNNMPPPPQNNMPPPLQNNMPPPLQNNMPRPLQNMPPPPQNMPPPPQNNMPPPPQNNIPPPVQSNVPPMQNLRPTYNSNMPPAHNSALGMGGTQQFNNYNGMPGNARNVQNPVPNIPNSSGMPQSSMNSSQFNNNSGMGNAGGIPNNMGTVPQNNMTGLPQQSTGWSGHTQGNTPSFQFSNSTNPNGGNMTSFGSRDAQNGGGMSMNTQNQALDRDLQSNYSPVGNMPGGNPYQS